MSKASEWSHWSTKGFEDQSTVSQKTSFCYPLAAASHPQIGKTSNRSLWSGSSIHVWGFQALSDRLATFALACFCQNQIPFGSWWLIGLSRSSISQFLSFESGWPNPISKVYPSEEWSKNRIPSSNLNESNYPSSYYVVPHHRPLTSSSTNSSIAQSEHSAVKASFLPLWVPPFLYSFSALFPVRCTSFRTPALCRS